MRDASDCRTFSTRLLTLKALVLLNLPRSGRDSSATAKAVRKFLKGDENLVLSSLEARFGLLDDSPSPKRSSKPQNDYEKLNDLTTKLIDETIADLKSFQIPSRRRSAKTSPPAHSN